ncbi:hypothetical protein C8J57DRAFT_1045492 [Mycena rebaudengoi]|nr:hypothetical protein C8J57DRAFT_1045492 [Mycena rebaudengoi]
MHSRSSSSYSRSHASRPYSPPASYYVGAPQASVGSGLSSRLSPEPDAENAAPPYPGRRPGFLERLIIFIFRKIPQQIYLHLLLRLPLLYFSRVARLFEDANLSLPDIRRMAVATAEQWKDGTPGALLTTWLPEDAAVSPHLLNFRHSWEGFIDSLLREWKTQNVVSALMLSAILTMLQIDAAAQNFIARTSALLSLISALMSLLFGSIYIIRFGTMRKMYKAASWAEEAQTEDQYIIWNVWVLLAIPAVWLAWSIIFFVTCIMVFVWQTGEPTDTDSTAAGLSPRSALALRIAVTGLLTIAMVYLFLIIRTFRHYGDYMDRKWNDKVLTWARDYARLARQSEKGNHHGGRSLGMPHSPVIVQDGHSATPPIVSGSAKVAPSARPSRASSIGVTSPSGIPPPPQAASQTHSRRQPSPKSTFIAEPTPSRSRRSAPVAPVEPTSPPRVPVKGK